MNKIEKELIDIFKKHTLSKNIKIGEPLKVYISKNLIDDIVLYFKNMKDE